MVNEDALRDALMALAEAAKNNYIMISAALAELQAVRETVRGLDPTFSDVLAQKQRDFEIKNDSVVQTVIVSYDVILQRLKDGEVC